MPALRTLPRVYKNLRDLSALFSGIGNEGRTARRCQSFMVTDSIADLLVRIKNGYRAKKKSVLVSRSKYNQKLLTLLASLGFIADWAEAEDKKVFKVSLKYQNKKPVLTEAARVSKPGLRVYKKWEEIPKVLGGFGEAIISTSKGLMTGKEARAKKLGGEVVAKIW